MRTGLAVVGLTLFGLVPSIGSACEYNDPTSASVSPVEQMAAASTPAATKMPTQNIVKPSAQTPAKTTTAKVKQVASQKVAASATN